MEDYGEVLQDGAGMYSGCDARCNQVKLPTLYFKIKLSIGTSRDRASWKRLFKVGLRNFPVLIVIVELFSDRIVIFSWS